MKLNIESTTKIVELNGVQCRLWEGETESGIPVVCFIPRVAVNKNENNERMAVFEKELTECKTPRADTMQFPSRLII